MPTLDPPLKEDGFRKTSLGISFSFGMFIQGRIQDFKMGGGGGSGIGRVGVCKPSQIRKYLRIYI